MFYANLGLDAIYTNWYYCSYLVCMFVLHQWFLGRGKNF